MATVLTEQQAFGSAAPKGPAVDLPEPIGPRMPHTNASLAKNLLATGPGG